MAVVTLPPQSYLGWKVSMSILHILAIGSTIYRLNHRFRIQKTWWDDYIVFIPLILDIIYWPLVCFRFTRVDPNNEPLSHRVLSSYWLSTFLFLLIVWVTRIVLALSLARVFPKKHPARLCAFVLIAFMVLSGISSILVTTLTCAQSSGLLIVNEGQDCIKGVGGYPVKNTFLFAADFVGDILLVIAPMVFFWRLRLPSRERRLILMVFCGSILTLLLVIAFKIICSDDKISPGKDAVLIVAGLASIETAISLFVCNLGVVSTCLYLSLLRLRNEQRPRLESTLETPRRPSLGCTCLSDRPLTPLTLTEISIFSSDNAQSKEPSNQPHCTNHDNV